MMNSSEGPLSARDKEYKVNFMGVDWIAKSKEERSDYVWENTKDGRILLSNSFCKEFQEEPLEDLAQKTFRAVNDLKIDRKSYTTFKDREAYRMQGRGTVDGVPVGLILLNTRRNNCYFDFVSITPQGLTIESSQDFNLFLEGVEFK